MLRKLTSRLHATGVGSLRQQPLREIQALLRLAQLLSQPCQLVLKRFQPVAFASSERRRVLGEVAALPQPLRPHAEPERERRVSPGM